MKALLLGQLSRDVLLRLNAGLGVYVGRSGKRVLFDASKAAARLARSAQVNARGNPAHYFTAGHISQRTKTPLPKFKLRIICSQPLFS